MECITRFSMKSTTMPLIKMISLTALCICFITISARVENNDNPEELFWLAARSLSSAVDFFQRNYRKVNLDALIGSRIVEGQLGRLLEHLWTNNVAVPLKYTNAIRRLKMKAGRFSDIAAPHVALKNITYYERVGKITDKGFWTLWRQARDAEPYLVSTPTYSGEALDEQTSDRCIAEMFGTDGKNSKKCFISNNCWRTMTSSGYQLYSLAHQIFYLECGLQFGCRAEIDEKVGYFQSSSLDELSTKFCSNMLAEAMTIAQNGFVFDDLFMEHASLCGILGFRQFFRPEWLKKIVSWQDPYLGCYKVKPFNGFSVKPRQKREEKILGNTCLCHTTTVAAGALAHYLRYILEYMIVTSNFNTTETIFGSYYR